MKLPLQWVLALAACLALSAAPCACETREENFTQVVNHFAPLGSSGTWPQRVKVVDDYWGGNGSPVFVFLAGEAPMSFFEFQTVFIRETAAKKFGALYVSLEHRFYSPVPANRPKPELDDESLRLLSSEQAIADAALFIRTHQAQNPDSKYVIWGCSYSAGVAAWFRSKHEDLVVGAVAPSGPVVATFNYTSFFRQFPTSAGAECAAAARAGSAQIETMMGSEEGLARLATAFNACEPITEANKFYFAWSITSAVGSADQMNNPTDDPATNFILNTTCALLQKPGREPYQAFADAAAFNDGQEAAAAGAAAFAERAARTMAAGSAGCVSYDEAAWLEGLRDPTNANRAWWWQKAVEFSYFKPSYADTVFLPNLPVEHIAGYAQSIFGGGTVDMSIPAIEWRMYATNNYYGGKSLNATNVLFTNGLSDPWHLLSITEPEGGVDAVTYEAGHCAPLTAPSQNDPPSLLRARDAIIDSVSKWLGQ